MRTRPLSLVLVVASVIALCGADNPQSSARGLDIYFIDAVGGAATLVVSPQRETVLGDSGWAGFEDRDPKRIEHVLKEVAGLDHLDHPVTTHRHRAHFGRGGGLRRRGR